MNGRELSEFKSLAGGLSFAGISNSTTEPEIIALHGWLDNAASFMPLFEHIEQSMLALDWPGHGLSEHRSSGAHYHFVDYCYDLLCLFEEKHWEPKHVVAHSMGAMVATLFAAAFPEKIKSLTLIDAVGLMVLDDEKTVSQLREGLMSRRTPNSTTTKSFTKDAAVKARMMVSDLQLSHCQMIIERNLKAVDGGFAWRSDPRLRTISPYRYNESQANQVLLALNVPCQLIYGSKGIELVENNLSRFKEELNNLQVIKLEGGHHVHMEQSEVVAKYVASFI